MLNLVHVLIHRVVSLEQVRQSEEELNSKVKEQDGHDLFNNVSKGSKISKEFYSISILVGCRLNIKIIF